MNKFLKISVLAGMTAALFCITDVVAILLTQNCYLESQGYYWADKTHLIVINFIFLFFIFLICSGLLVSIVPLIQAAGLLISVGFFVFYIISWVTFFYTNEFIDIESVRFFFHNFLQILEFVFQTSIPLFLLFFAILIFVPLATGPSYKRFMISLYNRLEANFGVVKIIVRILLVLIFTAMAISWICVKDNAMMQRTLRYNLSPQATLIADLAISSIRENWFKRKSNLVVHWDKQVSLGQFEKMASQPINSVPVILVVVESMRSDVLKDGRVMPNLFNLKQESLYFNNSFPASNESDYAWPAIMSSQYPLRSSRHHYYPKNITYPRVLIYDVLKEYGYKTAVISAQNEEWGGMRNYLDTGHLDLFYDANSVLGGQSLTRHDDVIKRWIMLFRIAGKIDDAKVVDHALQWIGKDAGKKFFLALNLQRSHFPYTWPNSFTPRFKPYEINFGALFGKYPKSEVPVMKNRYKNALSYIDDQMGRLVRFLKDHQLYDQSLIIVVGDHGEAFYEKDVACHAADLDGQSAHTFIMIKAPYDSVKGIRDDFVQNIDIPPSICHFLNINPHPAFQGGDILGPISFDHRPIFMSVNTPRADQDAIILEGWKFIKDYKNGREFLYNIKDDFMEDHNLILNFPAVASSLRNQLLAWREIQLDYYQDQEKQKEFYPPHILSGKIH